MWKPPTMTFSSNTCRQGSPEASWGLWFTLSVCITCRSSLSSRPHTIGSHQSWHQNHEWTFIACLLSVVCPRYDRSDSDHSSLQTVCGNVSMSLDRTLPCMRANVTCPHLRHRRRRQRGRPQHPQYDVVLVLLESRNSIFETARGKKMPEHDGRGRGCRCAADSELARISNKPARLTCEVQKPRRDGAIRASESLRTVWLWHLRCRDPA